jgi:AcrR family transcriptional regulator
MEYSLIRLLESSLAQHSGTDSEHIYGVAATSERRRNTVNRLLEEAKNIISEEGMSALTFRKLSGQCEMAVSNLQYYFPSSKDLIHALIRSIITEYLETLMNGSFLEISDPEQCLRTFLEVQMKDVQKKRTNAIFMALWDLAQRDSVVSKWLGELYSVERSLLTSMLAEIHPHESKREISERSAVIASLIEGMMPLFGPAAQPASDLGNVHSAAIRFACVVAGIEPPISKN